MTDKEYQSITRSEFESFLDDVVGDRWEEVGGAKFTEVRNFVGERVYKIPIRQDSINGDIDIEYIEIRVFSTIDKKTNKSRQKGEDSIKTVLWDPDIDGPVAGKTRTHRIKTWRKNLKKKIEDLHNIGEHTVVCEQCGGWLVKREGKYGEFLGCTNYPECQNTQQIDD